MTIIPSYNAHKVLYIKVLNKVQRCTGLPFASFPRIATIDSLQGHESDIVYLDWVKADICAAAVAIPSRQLRSGRI
jgi:hypothetical protein